MGERQVLLVAGEASGDLHGARLLEEMRRRAPDLRVFGLGGEELRAAGMETLWDSSEVAVVGITEVLSVLPRARRIFHGLLDAVEERGARCAVLIDSPELNLRLAKALKKRGVTVVYYVSPQIWAWRRRRIRTIRRVVDRMLVLFPFEEGFYREHGVDVVHVGHPLVDEVPALEHAWDAVAADELPATYRLALLPGSRASEIESLGPVFLRAGELLARQLPVELVWVRAPGVPRERIEALAARYDVPVRIVAADRLREVAAAHLAICASGTATLEVALAGTPLIVAYRVAAWSSLIARLMVRLPHFSLVNLVAERRVVPELFQGEATPERIAGEAAALLRDRAAIDRMRTGLATVRGALGEPGASVRAADAVLETCRS
ncbi:MAG: lipid-A-disaccharide synthase [Thermoanaerobaculia bacterium]